MEIPKTNKKRKRKDKDSHTLDNDNDTDSLYVSKRFKPNDYDSKSG